MIDILQLNNFQSHKKTVLELHPNVNVIVGSSDGGKTAIIRALRWLAKNRPVGDAFRSHWGGDTIVSAEIENQLVQRKKTKSDNQYILVSDVEEAMAGNKEVEEIYEGFGQDVPDDIFRVLGFDELNMQFQMDSPFLLSKTSGEVSRYLNSVMSLDIIDICNKNLISMQRKSNQKIQIIKKQRQELNDQLQEFDNLDKIEELVSRAEEIQENINAYKKEREELSLLLESIEKYSKSLAELGDVKKDEALVNKAIEVIEEYNESYDNREALSKLITNIDNQSQKLLKLKNKLKALKQELHEKMPDQCPLCGK